VGDREPLLVRFYLSWPAVPTDDKRKRVAAISAATLKSHKASDVQAVQETNTAYIRDEIAS
jgi:hypothetical protein